MKDDFPIMDSKTIKNIPWDIIAPHEPQAIRNHGQTLKRLAERGGLCPSEAVDVLLGQKWNTCPNRGSDERLAELVLRARSKAEE